MYYTRSSKGKIEFCREGNYTPEEYVKNCQKRGYDVIKASYNIIDILEVGDYVNGLPVIFVEEDRVDIGQEEDYFWLKNQHIKSIVTKEQFEQMAYKVEE